MGLRRFTLLTGSTGQVGQFLLVDLLRSHIPVAVLTRPDRSRSAQARIEDLISRFETLTSRRLPRPVILDGNLVNPGLGLTLDSRKWIEANCNSVIHSAANLSFKPAAQHPDNEPYRTNVNGTQQLVDLCRIAGIQEFHDISSAYVCGLRSDRILEDNGLHGQRFSNDYEDSKLQSEGIVHAAGFESVTVYRPSIVVDLDEGAQQLGERTIYYAFSVFQLLTKRFGLLDHNFLFQSVGLTGQERKNIVPSSWVARTIVEIFRRPELHGKTYHLTNPQGTAIADLFSAFQEVLYPGSHNLRPVDKPTSGWGDLTGIIEQFVETFTPYFRDDPQFDQTNLRHALNVCQIPNCPTIDSTALQIITRQQMPTKGQKPAHTGTLSSPFHNPRAQQQTDIWGKLAEAFSNRNPLNQQNVCDSQISLTLTGSGGGHWRIGFNSSCDSRDSQQSADVELLTIQPAIDVTDHRATVNDATVYTSAACWSELLIGEQDFTCALSSGALLIEADSPAESEENLSALINRLRDHLLTFPKNVSQSPEVIAHGK